MSTIITKGYGTESTLSIITQGYGGIAQIVLRKGKAILLSLSKQKNAILGSITRDKNILSTTKKDKTIL